MPLSDASSSSSSVCVVQLTDSHIFADAQQRLLGVDTLASLNAVIDLVQAECAQIDLVLATGDITQDASAQGYQRFIEAVSRLPGPCHWIPGNHDDALLMAELGDKHDLNRDWVDIGAWRVVLLDSSVPGQVHGTLGPQQLSLLDQALASAGARHVLICLHHHPVPMGSDWMEPLGLQDAAQWISRLDTDQRVRGVVWGHMDQELHQQRGAVQLLASPSTCVQFAVASADFATDSLAPGYRWLRLYDDGRLETAISRLSHDAVVPDPDATGY